MQIKTIKMLDPAHLPIRTNILYPFIVYTLVDYWSLPIWVFAVYMTLWSIVAIYGTLTNVSREKVSLK
jgi:hypothetical protein